LIFIGFDGLLRYLFAKAGVPALFYLKDVILLVPIFIYLVKLSNDYLLNKALFLFLVASVISLITSLFYLNSLPQTIFGIRTFLPLVGGLVLAPIILKEWKTVLGKLEIILVIFLIGIFINYFWLYPWEGFIYEVGDVDLVGSRDWTTFGIRRIAGFGRASFSSAIFIILLALFVIVYERKSWLKLFSLHCLVVLKKFGQKP
jgi:hypothetical protein